MKVYQENWYNKLRSDTDVKEVCEEIFQDDTGHTDPLTQELAKQYNALYGEVETRLKFIKGLTEAVKRNSEMTDKEVFDDICQRFESMTKDVNDFKDTEDFAAENIKFPYEVGYSPTGDGAISIDVYMVPKEDQKIIEDMVYDWSGDRYMNVYCVSPKETKMYHSSYYKEG